MSPKYLLHCRISPRDFDEGWIEFFKLNFLTPEIYFSMQDIETDSGKSHLEEMALWMQARNLRPSFHASLVANDPILFDAAVINSGQKAMDQVIGLAKRLNAKVIVCHPIFEKYRNKKNYSKWVDENTDFFKYTRDQTANPGLSIAIENVFEDEPGQILDLLNGIDSDRFLFCFDVGHFNSYSKAGMAKWFKLLGERLCEVHAHDNSGIHDEHLPPGEGSFPFAKLVGFLNSLNREIIITMEPLSKETAGRFVASTKCLFGIK